jgi:hypothetical protein
MKDFNTLMEALNFVECTHFFSLYEAASIIASSEYAGQLKPSPKGIWVPGAVEPNITTGTTVLVGHADGIVREISGIQTVEQALSFGQDLRDKEGRVLFSPSYHAHVKYQDTPNPYYMACRLALELVKHQVCQQVRFSFDSVSTSYIDRLFIDDELSRTLLEQGYFQQLIGALLEQVNNFVYPHSFHLHYVKQLGYSLQLIRGIDWRIYKYYEHLYADTPTFA